MKQTILALVLTLMGTMVMANEAFTKKERKFVVNHLKETKKDMLAKIGNLTYEQWTFKASPDSWSIAETCEHILKAEKRFYALITQKIVKTTPNPDLTGAKLISNDELLERVRDRSNKVKTASQFEPDGNFRTPAEFMAAFKPVRAESINYMAKSGENLKEYYMENPVFGTMSAYQWYLTLALHSERHLKQIEEILSNTAFPA